MDKTFKVAVIVLLSGMLVVLHGIWAKIPMASPTVGEISNADANLKQQLSLNMPLVRVIGAVDVNNTVDVQGTVEVQGNVDVDNVVQVEVSR